MVHSLRIEFDLLMQKENVGSVKRESDDASKYQATMRTT